MYKCAINAAFNRPPIVLEFTLEGFIFKKIPGLTSVQHRQEMGWDICLTTLGKKETFDL